MMFTRHSSIFLFVVTLVLSTHTLGLEGASQGLINPQKRERTPESRFNSLDSGVISNVKRNFEERVERARELLNDVDLSAPPLVESLKSHNRQVQSQYEDSSIGVAEASPGPLASVPASFPRSSGSRDPFAPTSLMQQEAQRQGVGPVFIPSAGGTQAVPSLHLRGYVTGNGNQPVALLEVGAQQVFLVREGDTISLQSAGQNNVLKVKKITKLSALVEVGTLGQVIVVR